MPHSFNLFKNCFFFFFFFYFIKLSKEGLSAMQIFKFRNRNKYEGEFKENKSEEFGTFKQTSFKKYLDFGYLFFLN